jgi:peptidoglycan/LPS O-acetylase OafA/YrhL
MIANRSAERSAQFRPEIEGLRAVAAILVAVFHIWFRRVSGGVDVFIVVSGFLITTGLLADADRDGTVQFLKFYARLAKRLVPLAALVTLAIVIAGVLLAPQSRWKGMIEQAAAAATYTENWLLAANSVDYLRQHEATSPFQHFWALAVQGQFYLMWPIIFIAALKMARSLQREYRSTLSRLFLAIFAASLAFSVLLTARNQPHAYFNTFARVWEFCMGGLLAIHLPGIVLSRALRIAMGWVGLLAIVACGALFQVSRVFPGYAALWPTTAALLIICAGSTETKFGADRFLGSKPMVYLGGISYGIYLWHFPILVFCRMYSDPLPLDAATCISIVIASIGLAALSNRLIENPIRSAKTNDAKSSQSFRIAAACLAPVAVALAGWCLLYAQVHHQATQALARQSSNYPGARALEADFRYMGDSQIAPIPRPTVVAFDREILNDEACAQGPDETDPKLCNVIGHEGDFTVAIVGASHSSQWIPALEDIAHRSGWRIVSLTKSNCPFYFGASVGEKQLASCHSWNERVLERLKALKPDIVFTTSTRFDTETDDEFVPDGYLEAWRRLEKYQVRIVALRDNPDFEFDVSACVELHGADSDRCALPRAKVLETPSPVELIEAPDNVRFIDLSDSFCDRSKCRPVVGNVLVYRHMNHITATYVRTMGPTLQHELERAIAAFSQPPNKRIKDS